MQRGLKNNWPRVLLFLVVLAGLLPQGSQAAEEKEGPPEIWLKEAEVDLNGDGRPERISFRVETGKEEFLLTVNGRSQRGRFEFPEYPPEGFRIVDLDTSDPYKEIMIKCLGSSDAHQYYFFAFDGRELKTMGCLYRCVWFQGDGVVLERGWHAFWATVDKYVVDRKTRKLKKVTPEFYHVGVSGEALKPFPLYVSRVGRQILTTVKEGSRVEILVAVKATYPDIWYLVVSEDKLVGWVREKELLECVGGLPLAA